MGATNHNVFTNNQNLFGSDRIHQMNFGPMGKMNGSRPQSPYHTQINVANLDQPLFDLNKGKQLKKGPTSTTSKRVEKVNVFRDPSRMCGLGCMVERENEYDNASELDLSANSSPLKLNNKRADAPFRLTARPFEQRPNSQLSTGVGL